MKTKTNAQKCEDYNQEMLELKNELHRLKMKWQRMNLFELDKEHNELWDSVVVEDAIWNIEQAEKALDGLL